MTPIDSRARAAIRDLPTYKPGTPIEEVKRTYRLSSVIKLASNENALGPSPKALGALRQAAASLHRYPDGTCTMLRVRLAKHLGVAPESIIVGNGSDELIVLALRAFVDPGDHVVVATPTFLIYELQARVCGASITTVPLRELRYDLPAMQAAITPSTKLVFIANPDNPTGTYVTKKEFESFLGGLPPEAIVFMDEAYHEFVEAKDYPQSLSYLDRASLIVTRSFSKAYGLAGLRVGYGVSTPDIIRAMEAMREPFNVNAMAQAAAAAALDDRAFLEKTRRLVRDGREAITTALSKLGLRWVPSVTNFVLIDVGPKAPQVAEALLRRGVIVRDMSAWHLDGYLRVTIGTPPENRRFIAALKGALR